MYLPEGVFVNKTNIVGGLNMAIKNIEMDRRDSASYRKMLKRGGFLSASYLSVSGFDVNQLKKLAKRGELDAVRCAIGKSIRWYYRERQAESARRRGFACARPVPGGTPTSGQVRQRPVIRSIFFCKICFLL